MSNYYMTHEKELQEFVEREVIYCVSQLVDNLLEADQRNHFASPPLHEEFQELYQSSPTYGEWHCPECEHQWEGEPDDGTVICPKCEVQLDQSTNDCFEATEYAEIYEHWIVSDWLAEKLESKGEAICKDFYGLTVWGRATTGQSIDLDGVISEIHKELNQ